MVSRYQKYKASYQAYYQANRARILEQQRKWRKEHPDCEERRHREWTQKHPEYFREYKRNHSDSHNANNRKWRKKHPEKKRAQNLMSHNPEKYPLSSECEFCGETEKLEHGHIDYDFPEIYLTVCRGCNCWMDRPMVQTK